MFAARNNAAVAQALDPLLAERDYDSRIGAEGTVANNRIPWIRVNIEHRCEIEIDTHNGEFFSGCPRGSVRELAVAGCTDACCGRKVSERLGKPMNSSSFLIDGDKRRQAFAGVPESLGQRKNLRGITAIMAKEDEAAEGIVFHRHPFFATEFLGADADQEHLGDFFSYRGHHQGFIIQPGQFEVHYVNSPRQMTKNKYIVVEGPIGVGKTSLAKILANEFQARTVFERVEDNPFLAKFYKARELYAFQNQTFFLLNRYQQQMELNQQDLFNQNTIADYLFAKDKIFASLTLSSEELNLYQQIYALLNTRVPKPDLVVYLQARPEVLYKRVKKRDKKYERGVTFEYLSEVAQAYNQFFFHYDETPLLVVNTSEIDFVASGKDLADLIKEINNMGLGTQHYIPLGSR
jgi:deoxyguanosine kinase